MISVDLRDLVGGIAVAMVGGAFFLAARNLPEAPAGQIGPGFVPAAVGLVALGLGLIIALRAFRTSARFPDVELRPVFAVFAAVATFGLLVKSTGLAPALIGTTTIAAMGSARSRPLAVAGLAIAVAIGCWLIFIVALGLPVQALRNPF